MDHLAIMKKSWGLTQKILSGEKKIESIPQFPFKKVEADIKEAVAAVRSKQIDKVRS